MQKIYLALFFFLPLYSFSQEIDRSNYQLLWEISGNELEQPSYLFGTFHSNDNEIFDFPDSLYIVLNQSEAIVLETDITELMDEADVIKNYSSVYDSTGIDWIIPEQNSNEITYTSYGSDEGRPQFIDLYFKQIADNCGKKFYALESLQDQMKVGLSNELKETYVVLDEKPSKEQMKQLYLEGNAKKLHDITKQSTINFVNLYEELITDRNKVMVKGIDTLIRGQKVFCAVGAAHLLGEEGIIPLLREKGYKLRTVNSNFSAEQSSEEIELASCRGYIYEDLRFGFSIQFSGKPKVKEEEQGSRFVQYQEMGQGNTYAIRTTHYETIDDLERVAADFFRNDQLEVRDYNKIEQSNGVIIHEGKIIEQNGQAYWMRSFHRNEILYLVFCTGGPRFVNSDRPQKFFKSFEFKKVHNDVVSLDSTVISPTQTLSVKLPRGFLEHEEQKDADKYWRAKWFNPNNGESFYVYENVLTDNSLYFTDTEFGEYLLSEFDSDSINFYDLESNSSYSEKSFVATKKGRKAYGKIRLIGNMLHFSQYTGKDSIRANEFISSMKFLGFEPIADEVQIRNKVFMTSVTKSGFRPVRSEEKYGYRTTEHYFLNDVNNVISFEVYVKTFKPWAFSKKGTKQLLMDQLIWPNESIPVKIDTNFNLLAKNPYLDFEITYTSSKNRWKGRTFLNGNKIVTYSQIHPTASVEAYQSLTYLDKTIFELEEGDISNYSEKLIIEELQLNGTKNVKQLASKGHIDHSAALEILFLQDLIFERHDTYGDLQGVLISNLDDGYSSDSLIQLWKSRANNTNTFLTEQLFLHLSSSVKTSSDLKESINYAEIHNLEWNNFEEVFVNVVDSKEYFDLLISDFEKEMKDSISWELTFLMEDAMQYQYFKDYFYSDSFEQIAMRENQGDWVIFRYFELLYEFNQDKSKIMEVIDSWKPRDDFNLGVSVAWKEILGLKSKREKRKKVASDFSTSTAYAKVMAVTNQRSPELYNYEEIVGLLAFDHYEDEFIDPEKSIEYIKNLKIKEGQKEVEYALYKCVENKEILYLTRKVNSEKRLPSYKDFGSDSHFFQYDHPLDEKEITRDLEKRLKEVYGI
jgi:uncharacterized protein YbaP (TraB family)